MNKAFLYIFFIAVLCSCSKNTANKCTLHLSLINGENKSLYLYELKANVGDVFIDSSVIDKNGHAKLIFEVDTPSLFVLKTPEKKLNAIVIAPLTGENISISADYNDIALTANCDSCIPHFASFDNNSNNEFDNRFDNGADCNTSFLIPFQRKMRCKVLEGEKLFSYWEQVKTSNNATHIRDSIAELADSLFICVKEEAIRLGMLNNCSLIPIFLSQQAMWNRLLFNISIKYDLEILSSWAKEMEICLPENPHTIRFRQNIERFKQQNMIDSIADLSSQKRV